MKTWNSLHKRSGELEDFYDYQLNKNNSMQKIQLALTSTVFWTVVLMVAIAVVPQLKSVLSPVIFGVIEAALAVLASYFNVSPSPAFTSKLNRIK